MRVGRHGKHTHLFDPYWESRAEPRTPHACKSGVNAGRGGPSGAEPEVYFDTEATMITCYRCAKLATMNMQLYGSPVPPEPR